MRDHCNYCGRPIAMGTDDELYALLCHRRCVQRELYVTAEDETVDVPPMTDAQLLGAYRLLGDMQRVMDVLDDQPTNCTVRERTADGVPVGRCWLYLRNGICPRHGLTTNEGDDDGND